MLPAPVNVTPSPADRPTAATTAATRSVAGGATSEPPALLLAAYREHQERTGRGNVSFTYWARVFVRRWPDVADWADEPLAVQLAANSGTRPLITFLLVTGRLHPSWDYLVHRKFSSIWRDLPGTTIGQDIDRFLTAAAGLGYSQRVSSAMASQVMARVLFSTGKRLDEVTHDDFDALAAAGAARQQQTGRTWKHYRATATATKTVLFHLGILPVLAALGPQRQPFERRLAGVPEPMHSILRRYLDRKSVTCKPATVSSMATRLAHFGTLIAQHDPAATPATMTRTGHIEPWLVALARTPNTMTGEPLSRAEQARRILAVANFLREITEWDWPEAPPRTLLHPSDNPRLPQPLPRFLPPDADRRLTAALTDSPHRLAADALLLQRACGLRIGELLDLEMDAVIDVTGAGSWLKVPLGKLDTERMVPIDPEILTLLDRITATRSPGRPIRNPRTGRPADFLFTAHGRRLGQNALRHELNRATAVAGLGHVTPHQLRHTYATALVNAGVSLQALMAILGHVSAEMSLRYGRLFDATIRTEYERALHLAKTRIGTLPAARRDRDETNGPGRAAVDWRDTATLKTVLAGGHCLRAPIQGPCTYANICEHCPSFHPDVDHLDVLTRQRDIATTLADDATHRGWDSETERHLRLITRINTLIDAAATRQQAM
jgi:integrase